METVSVRIANKNIASIRDVDSVREARDLLAANATLELTGFAEDCDAMSLEVANVEIVAYNSKVD